MRYRAAFVILGSQATLTIFDEHERCIAKIRGLQAVYIPYYYQFLDEMGYEVAGEELSYLTACKQQVDRVHQRMLEYGDSTRIVVSRPRSGWVEFSLIMGEDADELVPITCLQQRAAGMLMDKVLDLDMRNSDSLRRELAEKLDAALGVGI